MKRKISEKEKLENANRNILPYDKLVDIKYRDVKSNSWFDINKTKLDDFEINIINNSKIEKKLIKCKKLILSPTIEQQNELKLWIEGYRKIYNETLTVIKRMIKNKEPKICDWKYIRTYKMLNIKNNIIDQYNIPSNTADGAFMDVCRNLKSCLSNLKNKNIKHFKMRYIKQSKQQQCIYIPKGSIKENGFSVRKLGNMLNIENYDYKNIKHDCKLLYRNNEFSLLIPEDIKQKNNNSNKVMSIDPGIKTFLTGISNNSIYKFGNNLSDVIRKDLDRIDYLNKDLNKRRKQLIKIAYERIKNRIKDMHWKCINHIINKSNVGTIILGNWSTKSICSNKKYLDKTIKRISMSLNFYKFKERLRFKCQENKVQLILTNEAYTSKICCKCGHTNDKFTNRILNCTNCKYSIDRDINGSCNILLKNL